MLILPFFCRYLPVKPVKCLKNAQNRRKTATNRHVMSAAGNRTLFCNNHNSWMICKKNRQIGQKITKLEPFDELAVHLETKACQD